MTTDETWRPVAVPGYEHLYLVSSTGKVRRSMRSRGSSGRVLKPGSTPFGYEFVVLSNHGFAKNATVHSLVAGAFLGPRPIGMQVRHLDGDKLNNNVANLSYGTPSENQLDRTLHGTNHQALKTHCPKGHAYTPENTLLTRRRNGRSYRSCRECDNTRRRVAEPKSRARGEASGTAKLTESIVREARARHRAGESLASIARDHGVTRATMRRAVLGITWTHLD